MIVSLISGWIGLQDDYLEDYSNQYAMSMNTMSGISEAQVINKVYERTRPE